MPFVSQLYFKTAILFLIVGIAMGLHMSISEVHDVTGAHAHANLLGWVTMAIFGGYFALNPGKAQSRLAILQYGAFTLAVVVMIPSLYLLLKGYTAFGPLVAGSSFLALAAVILFAVIVFSKDASSTVGRPMHPAAAE